MRVHRFRESTILPARRDEVFPFFSAAENLGRITPPELHFEMVTPVPVDMRVGALITYRLRLFGIPFGWVTRVTRWDPPNEFVDEQSKGPYRQWIHRHRFTDRGADTLMDDEVDYALPLYPFGEVAAPLVALQVKRIFTYRAIATRKQFG
jgi:ligand-binding SRPBCC domain-containing protein